MGSVLSLTAFRDSSCLTVFLGAGYGQPGPSQGGYGKPPPGQPGYDSGAAAGYGRQGDYGSDAGGSGYGGGRGGAGMNDLVFTEI